MHRNDERSPILYSSLVLLALILLLIPPTHVLALRGRTLSALCPVLEMIAPAKSTPIPASILYSSPASGKDNTKSQESAPTKTIQPENYAERLDELQALLVQYEFELNKYRAAFPDQAERPKVQAGLGADVIARRIMWQEPVLGLNRGTADGVRLHAGVLHRGAVAGRIITAGDHASSMALVTHPGFSIAARLSECRLEGVLQGSKNGGPEKLCRMAVIGRDVLAKPGEQVVTSGYDGVFPEGLWLGSVESVKKTGDVQWEVWVRPACNDSAFECVRILTVKPPQVPWPSVTSGKKTKKT